MIYQYYDGYPTLHTTSHRCLHGAMFVHVPVLHPYLQTGDDLSMVVGYKNAGGWPLEIIRNLT